MFLSSTFHVTICPLHLILHIFWIKALYAAFWRNLIILLYLNVLCYVFFICNFNHLNLSFPFFLFLFNPFLGFLVELRTFGTCNIGIWLFFIIFLYYADFCLIDLFYYKVFDLVLLHERTPDLVYTSSKNDLHVFLKDVDISLK